MCEDMNIKRKLSAGSFTTTAGKWCVSEVWRASSVGADEKSPGMSAYKQADSLLTVYD